MAQAPIIPVTPVNTGLQWLTQCEPVNQASANAFGAGMFVTASGSGSGITVDKYTIATSYTGVTSVYGVTQKAALASTAEPYLTPTGTTCVPISPRNTEFWIPTATTAGATGTGDATALVIGSTYRICAFTTSGYSGQQALDSASVAGNNTGLLVYTGKIYPGYNSDDKNVPVSVRVVAAQIQ